MTTTIITNLLGPMCEMFYKYKASLDIHEANINTIRGYGYNTSFSLNFGFEIFEPLDINNISLQPGVFTTQSVFATLPDLSAASKINVANEISLQELPGSGIGLVTYRGQTLPIVISIYSHGNSIMGIASNFATNGVPYTYSSTHNESIIRSFESEFTQDSHLSALIFVNLEDTTFIGINTGWSAIQTSLYNAEIMSYRYNNGYGQFFALPANAAFIPSNLYVNQALFTNIYNSTYMMVYNWINLLTWTPDFTTWLNANYTTLPEFLNQFLIDYYGLP